MGTSQASDRPGPSRSLRWAAIGVVLLIIGGAGFVGAMEYTSSPEFCRSCHLMETRYVSWHRDVHADSTDCITCHSEPGYVNELKAHASATRYLYVLATGNSSGPIITGTAFDSACLSCHEQDGLPETLSAVASLTGGGHVPAHGAHIDRGVACADCHFQPSFHVSEVASPMLSCVDCHAERALAAPDCQRCHAGAVPSILPGPVGLAAP